MKAFSDRSRNLRTPLLKNTLKKTIAKQTQKVFYFHFPSITINRQSIPTNFQLTAHFQLGLIAVEEILHREPIDRNLMQQHELVVHAKR